MKKQIRQGVFETNSSSTHSVSIPEQINEVFTKNTLITDKNNNIVLNGGQFGWEIEDYTDALTKANYLAVAAWDENHLNLLKEVIKETTSCNEVIVNVNRDWNSDDTSYIDHQSSGTVDFLFKSKEMLKDFIFNTQCILHTDNDNH